WNVKLKKETIFATEDIPAGSEIVIDYLCRLMTREERLKTLTEDFRFTCQCKNCTTESSEEYDAAVNRINECSDLIESCATSNPRRSIGYVREALRLIEKTDGRCKRYSNYMLAKKWADLLLEEHRRDEGEVNEMYELYLGYSQNPKSYEKAGWDGYVNLTGA
ncbi:hypothetical protein BGZ65_010145, partial [Modicella reniformis]